MKDVRRISFAVAMDTKTNNRVSYNLSGNSRWNFLLRSKLRAFYLKKKKKSINEYGLAYVVA